VSRRALVFVLPVLGLCLTGIASACQSGSNPGMDLNSPDAEDQGSGNGGSGGSVGSGGSRGTGATDAQVKKDVAIAEAAAADHALPVDATNPGKDTGPPPPTDSGPTPCSGCKVLATVVYGSPVSLALDPTYVYWTEGGSSGAVRQVKRTGGAATTYDGALSNPQIIKVSDPYIAWSASGATTGTGTVSLQDVGSPSTPGSGLTAPFGVGIDSATLYWVSSAGGGASVQSEYLAGGTLNDLGVATGGFLPQGLAVNATSIYFVAYLTGGGGGLFELPVTGGTPTEIWTGDSTSQPVDVTLDASNVYWTDQGDGAVYSMPLGGGTVSTMASKSTVTGPVRIAVDSTNVYFSDTAGMALYKVAIGGTTPTALVKGLAVVGVAADTSDGNVYFSSDTQILSIAK
jgi:hypothetical protein